MLTGTDLTGGVPKIDGVAIAVYTVDSSTQITCTLPAHASGTVSITVETAGGTSNALTLEYWDETVPATPTGLWIDYAGSPWKNYGSVGGDAANVSSPPSVGASLNGHGTADFVATNVLKTSTFVESYTPNLGFNCFVLVNLDTVPADGAVYDAPGIWSDPYQNVGVTASGVVAAVYDNDATWKSNAFASYHPFTTGAWHMLEFTVNGAGNTALINVDNGTATTFAIKGQTARPAAAYVANIGQNAPSSTTSIDGRIARVVTYGSPVYVDADRVKLKKLWNQRYDLSM